MNLLPILVREMRALCRKRGTYATRIALAIPVLLVWGLFALIPEVRGDSVLAIQAVVCQIFFAFGAALGASDAISSERRGGTLGLLLLTPLRSYQVLLGKLLTRISQFLLCLWAVVPILALPLLAGGVGPSDVAKVIAGILAGCLLGMAIGLFASVICRSALASACLSFAALLGCYLLPILIVGTLGSMGYFSPVPDFIWLGPIAVTHNVPGEFGSLTLNLSILGGLALLLLLLSMLLFSFVWMLERKAGGTIPGRKSARKTVAPRPPIGDLENPARILHARFHRSGLVYRIGTGILLLPGLLLVVYFCFHLLTGTTSRYDDALLVAFYLTGLPLMGLAYLRASLEAPSLLHEDRKTGMLELLLIAPLSRMATLRGLGHPAGTQLIWNGALILACTSSPSLPGASWRGRWCGWILRICSRFPGCCTWAAC